MEAPVMPVANAPCSFGVDEILPPGCWMPEPDEMLDWMVDLGYIGTELGAVGFMGEGRAARERMARRGLALVGAFLPQRFTHPECAEEDRAWLRESLALLRDSTPDGSAPFAILCDGLDEQVRLDNSGRIAAHPEATLTPARLGTLVDNLHRAAEICRRAGFEAVLHPHAGTWVETADEIDAVMNRIDPALVGLCLDTGHFRFGGADPTEAVHAYHALVRHVHLKECSVAVLDEIRAAGEGFPAAVERHVFTVLGDGDSGIPGVLDALRQHDYRGWLVVEQDVFLGDDDTRASIVEAQRRNREYLRSLGV